MSGIDKVVTVTIAGKDQDEAPNGLRKS